MTSSAICSDLRIEESVLRFDIGLRFRDSTWENLPRRLRVVIFSARIFLRSPSKHDKYEPVELDQDQFHSRGAAGLRLQPTPLFSV